MKHLFIGCLLTSGMTLTHGSSYVGNLADDLVNVGKSHELYDEACKILNAPRKEPLSDKALHEGAKLMCEAAILGCVEGEAGDYVLTLGLEISDDKGIIWHTYRNGAKNKDKATIQKALNLFKKAFRKEERFLLGIRKKSKLHRCHLS